MSLKSVEMQVAVQRTEYAGNLQNQLLQKPLHDQDLQAAETMKRLAEQQKKANEVDELSEQLKTKQEDGNPNQQQRRKPMSKRKAEAEETEKIAHPYKGHHIDLRR